MAGETPENKNPIKEFHEQKTRILLAALDSPDNILNSEFDIGNPDRPLATYALVGESAMELVDGSLRLTKEGRLLAEIEKAKSIISI